MPVLEAPVCIPTPERGYEEHILKNECERVTSNETSKPMTNNPREADAACKQRELK